MFISKLKIPALILIAAGLAGGGAHHALAQKVAKFAKGNWTPPQINAPVVSVAPEGKAFTVQIPPRIKGEQTQRINIKLTDETKLRFSAVASGGARLVEGYQAQVWLEADSSNTAATVHMMGPEHFKPVPQISGRVAKVAQGGQQVTIETDAIPAKGKGPGATAGTPAKSLTITIPEQAVVTFSRIGPNGAKITEGYQAAVFLKEGSNDVAAAVQFAGNLDVATKGAMERPPHCQGKVAAVAANEKEMTLELAAKSKWQPPKLLVVEMNESTQIVYHNVPPEGAKPTPGYGVQVWFEEDGMDPPKKVRFSGPMKDQGPDLAGSVRRVSPDTRAIILADKVKQKGEEPGEVSVAITDKTKMIYHNVPLSGAKPIEGMGAQVWLNHPSETNAARILFFNTKE